MREPFASSLLTHIKWVLYPLDMELVQFSDALRLTELPESQLREWCGKRGLFQPTVPARGPGRLALFSWQDIIALRIFREVTLVFGGRASGWAAGIADLRQGLDGQFFPSLWGKSAIFASQQTAVIGMIPTSPLDSAALIVPLDPHLGVITSGGTIEELQGQLPLVTQVGSSR